MSDEIAIKVDHVSKTFKLPHEKNTSIKGAVVNFYKRKRSFEHQQVLKDVSFEIKQGEFFGIVGRNGSGKSTLLKMLAGIYSPTEGNVTVNGKLTPFIELGVGFNPELTGRENVFLNGALLGFNRAEMLAMYDDIVAFAELQKFMDQKLKNYSSGMQVRLAFSIAIRAKSDILLIDEVLAVGDAAFQSKCFDYFYELKKTGTTVIFVSHDRASLERFCERGILINDGELIEGGPMQKVLKSYSKVVLRELAAQTDEDNEANPDEAVVYEEAEIQNTAAYGADGSVRKKFGYGDKVTVSFEVLVKKQLTNPVLGITVWRRSVENPIFATNTLIGGIKETGIFEAGERMSFSTSLPQGINDGEYYIEPAIANDATTVFYDQQPKAANFFISGSNNPHALLASDLPVKISKKGR